MKIYNIQKIEQSLNEFGDEQLLHQITENFITDLRISRNEGYDSKYSWFNSPTRQVTSNAIGVKSPLQNKVGCQLLETLRKRSGA